MKSFIAPNNRFNIRNLFGTLFFFVGITFLLFLYGIDISSVILIAILAVYLKFFYPKKGMPLYLDYCLLIVIGIAVVIVPSKILSFSYLTPFYIPAIGYVILITLLFDDLHLSIIFSIALSSLAASAQQEMLGVAVGTALLNSSLVAAMLSYRVRTRFKIIRSGLVAGIVQFAVAFLVLGDNTNYFISMEDLRLLNVCVLSGTISSAFITGFLPLFEYLFRVVTTISLLELSDFNHPLLKKMILEAPGTYQHSLVVANLSESAAESIGANPLFARVGAYYHDIGKVPKAHYFVENQIPYRDVHKDLKPSISKMIIINHVKEGIELAKKFRLNPRIIDFIVQHHGRSLVYYFYHRAKAMEPSGGHEEEYRYPGPRPQSKEIAIVSLADTIEALSRTLEEPTPARIKEMVRDVVRKKFLEGELDESDLTLKDLGKISESFSRILNAIFHTRVNYPSENADKKYSKPQENKSS